MLGVNLSCTTYLIIIIIILIINDDDNDDQNLSCANVTIISHANLSFWHSFIVAKSGLIGNIIVLMTLFN